jgi:hypothetical protein
MQLSGIRIKSVTLLSTLLFLSATNIHQSNIYDCRQMCIKRDYRRRLCFYRIN